MRKIQSFADDARGVVTYELLDGRRVQLDIRQVQEYGAFAILKSMGLGKLLPTEPLPVFQCGRQVGTLPPEFDPDNVRSLSPWYDPRPGDFLLEEDHWVANRMLGFGDLAAIPGFVFMRREP